jgi:inner membrane protein involved in colicin E2 resistance
MGSETKLTAGSNWPHPAVMLPPCPAERSIRKDGGFSATWSMSYLARSTHRLAGRGPELRRPTRRPHRRCLVLPGDSYPADPTAS